MTSMGASDWLVSNLGCSFPDLRLISILLLFHSPYSHGLHGDVAGTSLSRTGVAATFLPLVTWTDASMITGSISGYVTKPNQTQSGLHFNFILPIPPNPLLRDGPPPAPLEQFLWLVVFPVAFWGRLSRHMFCIGQSRELGLQKQIGVSQRRVGSEKEASFLGSAASPAEHTAAHL